GLAIALFHANDRIYAFADLCVHQDRSLVKGTLLHGRVICPGHQWRFDLETGYEEDQDLCQPVYPVLVRDETVLVDLTPRPAPAASGKECTACPFAPQSQWAPARSPPSPHAPRVAAASTDESCC